MSKRNKIPSVVILVRFEEVAEFQVCVLCAIFTLKSERQFRKLSMQRGIFRYSTGKTNSRMRNGAV